MKHSCKGKFLVASPVLFDPNFRQSVIFILEHDERGAFGFIVNQLSDEVKELTTGLTPFLGGPVSTHRAYVLHTHEGSMTVGREVLPGYFVSDDAEIYEEVLAAGGSLKIFQGYSGWGPGQLEAELQANSWIEAVLDDAVVFSSTDSANNELYKEQTWRTVLKHKKGLYAWFAKNVKNPLYN